MLTAVLREEAESGDRKPSLTFKLTVKSCYHMVVINSELYQTNNALQKKVPKAKSRIAFP